MRGGNQYGFQGGELNQAPAPKNKRQHNGRAVRAAKRIGAITLSAVLFGGVAAGTFQAVNYAAGSAAYAAAAADGTQSGSALQEGQESFGTLQTAALSAIQTAKGNMDVSDIAESVMPSIVSITNKSVQEIRNYFSMFGYVGQSQLMETESAGSGFIIGKNAEELLIVTNCHVVENADTLSVCFVDNQAYEASIKGADSDNDLAVIAIPLSSISADTMAQIKVAAIGDSDALKVGEQVVAIGNALGYGQSVTTGIVSALNREVIIENNTNTLIQTDAAINPGNSGGALLNMDGQLVGINSAKYSDTNVEGMGYAIPVDDVVDIIEGLMNRTIREEKAPEGEQGFLGITGQDVTSDVSDAYDMPKGVYITSVEEGSGAAAAGLKKGDIITRFDGSSVGTLAELKEQLSYYKTGEQVKLTVSMAAEGEYQEQVVTVLLGKNQEK